MQLTLPYPPSVNHYWRHTSRRTYLTAQAKTFRQLVVLSVRQQVQNIETMRGPLAVEIVANAPDNRCRDLDNILKATLDALAHAGVYADDSQIRRLTMSWGNKTKGGSMDVVIDEIA